MVSHSHVLAHPRLPSIPCTIHHARILEYCTGRRGLALETLLLSNVLEHLLAVPDHQPFSRRHDSPRILRPKQLADRWPALPVHCRQVLLPYRSSVRGRGWGGVVETDDVKLLLCGQPAPAPTRRVASEPQPAGGPGAGRASREGSAGQERSRAATTGQGDPITGRVREEEGEGQHTARRKAAIITGDRGFIWDVDRVDGEEKGGVEGGVFKEEGREEEG